VLRRVRRRKIQRRRQPGHHLRRPAPRLRQYQRRPFLGFGPYHRSSDRRQNRARRLRRQRSGKLELRSRPLQRRRKRRHDVQPHGFLRPASQHDRDGRHFDLCRR
jgi:hypothetical protein